MRNLTPALYETLSEFIVPGSDEYTQHRQMLVGLQCLRDMDRIVEQHKDEFTLPPDAVNSFTKLTYDFLSENNALAAFYQKQTVMIFHVTMKYHYLVHIALLSNRLNPALGWCYGGESFLKHVKRMVGQAAHGTKLQKVGDKVIDGYLRGVHMLLTSGVLVK